MASDEIWPIEEAFWTGGSRVYSSSLDPGCLMTFPGLGTLDSHAALEGLKAAPRWNRVSIEDRRLSRPAPDIVTLGYRARAVREGSPPYEAWCSSSYRRDGGRWLLFQHQQTPA